MFKNVRTQKCWLLLGIILLSAGVIAAFSSPDGTETKTDAFSSAGGRVSSTNFETVFILGQSSPPDVSESSNFRNIGGFLAFVTSRAECSISGKMTYCSTVRPVMDGKLILSGAHSDSQMTNSNGDYLFENLLSGSEYTVTPAKDGDLRNAIAGSDALMVLQYLAFMRDLTDHQKFSADVTEDGNVSGADALAVLRYLAFFTTNIASTGQWRFIPTDTTFELIADAVADFKAFLLGDVNENWGSTTLAKAGEFTNAVVALGNPEKRLNQEVSIPIMVETDDQVMNTLIFSLEYDSTLLTYKSTALISLSQDFMMAANGTEPGKIHVAMAGVKGIANAGTVLNVVFAVNSAVEQTNTQLNVTRAFINDLASLNLTSLNLDFETLKVGIPKQFALSQNYPNPFNPETVIEYQLPEPGRVSLKAYTILGQEVRTLVDEEKLAGYQQVIWDGKDDAGQRLASGVYLYQLQVGESVLTKKFILLK